MIHNGRRSSGSNIAVEINRKKTSNMGVDPERLFRFVGFVNISYFKKFHPKPNTKISKKNFSLLCNSHEHKRKGK